MRLKKNIIWKREQYLEKLDAYSSDYYNNEEDSVVEDDEQSEDGSIYLCERCRAHHSLSSPKLGSTDEYLQAARKILSDIYSHDELASAFDVIIWGPTKVRNWFLKHGTQWHLQDADKVRQLCHKLNINVPQGHSHLLNLCDALYKMEIDSILQAHGEWVSSGNYGATTRDEQELSITLHKYNILFVEAVRKSTYEYFVPRDNQRVKQDLEARHIWTVKSFDRTTEHAFKGSVVEAPAIVPFETPSAVRTESVSSNPSIVAPISPGGSLKVPLMPDTKLVLPSMLSTDLSRFSSSEISASSVAGISANANAFVNVHLPPGGSVAIGAGITSNNGQGKYLNTVDSPVVTPTAAMDPVTGKRTRSPEHGLTLSRRKSASKKTRGFQLLLDPKISVEGTIRTTWT